MWKSVQLLIISFIVPIQSFFIGVATSSYQIEGWNVGECIWDKYTQEHNLHNVENATNHYVLYKKDIELMKDLGIRHYRFSISWNRMFPENESCINKEGVDFYHSLIDTLIENEIEPFVTLYHWDLPQYLQTDIQGWLDSRIINSFLNYSKAMFKEYGSKVKYWMTINEPLTTSTQGYGGICTFAPGICSDENMFESARNQLLAHAYVSHYYKQNYNGQIGIVINTNWIEPINENAKGNALIAMERMFGWFMDPLFFGEFPSILQSQNRPFTEEEKDLLIHSLDFLGLNHYTTYYINENGQTSTDSDWYPAQSTWLFDAPLGMKNILEYIQEKYTKTLPIYITESGFSQQNDSTLDLIRTHYLVGYIFETYKKIQEGMDQIKGFFVWAFLDNFEWASGYNETFGIVQVNFTTYERKPKLSAYTVQNIIKILKE
jgi:beta-glucosidase/6-phospho-beta-glucosidase/beta-galactosidase